MKIISGLVLLLCVLCGAYLYMSYEGGEVVNPDQTPPANAVAADDAAPAEHKVMKPAVPATDDDPNAEEKESTQPESGETDPQAPDTDEPENTGDPDGDSGG